MGRADQPMQRPASWAGANTKTLLIRIPFGTPDTFEFEPRSQRGFKFDWTDASNTAWHVHAHEPDQGAQAGHAGGLTWVVRIRKNQDWLLSARICRDMTWPNLPRDR